MGQQSGRIDGLHPARSFVESFVIMENAKAAREVQELARGKAELSTLWMVALDVVVDGKSFVQQHATGLQCFDERGKERSVQVKEGENDIVRFMSKSRWLRRLLQVEHSRPETREVPRVGALRKLCEGLLIMIDGFDLVTQRGEE